MRRPMTMRGTRPAPTVQLVPERPLTRRAIRSPQHTFRLRVRPWQLVPAGIAPVLPGDTVKAASMKMRVLSQPIADKLSGWWLETYLFYIRLGDMEDQFQDSFKAMILADSPLPKRSGNAWWWYESGHSADLMQWILSAVFPYFRNEDGYYPPSVDGYPVVKIAGPGGAFDSIASAEGLDTGEPDDADEWVKRWQAYQGMRQDKLTTATWEEYLGMNGVALPPQLVQPFENRAPELMHFTRDWQFPVQAVEPSTGVPSALVQWSLADSLKRGRFCAEPGFIAQFVCIRPKAYLKNQRANMTGYLMRERNAWHPPALDTDPHARLQMFDGAAGEGPVFGATKDYWIDPNDLLTRGDQFLNFDLGSTVPGALAGINVVDLPKELDPPGSQTVVINHLYPNAADMDGCFSGANKYIDVDGVTTFKVASVAGRGDATGKRKGMA